jgi:MFS family permease
MVFTRNFILAFIAQFAFAAVFHSLIPTLPIYLSRLGANEAEIGVLIGSFSLSSLVLRPFVGRALLKIQEKHFMIAGAVLFALTSVGYLLVPPFWPLLLVRFLQGIGFAFFQTAAFTFIANISLEAHRGQTLSFFSLSMNLSAALAPSLGMFLINHFSFTALFLVCLGLSLCALFLACGMERRQITPLHDSSTESGSLFSRKALPPSIINFFFIFTWGALGAFFPLYATKHGVANPGLFFTTVGIMLILGRALGGKILDVYRGEIIILPCLAACIISMVILVFSKTLPMFILVGVVWGIGHAFLFPTLVVYALNRAGSSPGPIMGTLTASIDVGLGLGPMIMAIILHTAGYPIMFLCLALTGVVNLSYFYFFVSKRRTV